MIPYRLEDELLHMGDRTFATQRLPRGIRGRTACYGDLRFHVQTWAWEVATDSLRHWAHTEGPTGSSYYVDLLERVLDGQIWYMGGPDTNRSPRRECYRVLEVQR